MPILNTKGLLMPEARYVGPDGAETTVQLPDTALRLGAAFYDAATHKGKLVCLHCDTPVHFRKEKPTIVGDNLRGARPHFASNDRDAHDKDCLIPIRVEEEDDGRKYDPAKGYRIHYNTGQLKESFDVKGRLYSRRPDKKITIHDEELASREPFSVRGAGDFLRLFRKGDPQRLRDSVIVNGTAQIPWKDFFVRYAWKAEGVKKNVREDRFIDLVRRAFEHGSPLLALVEFDLTKPAEPAKDCIRVNSKPIKCKGEDGGKQLIIPTLYCDGPRAGEAAAVLTEKGKYLVLGAVRLNTVVENGETRHYLNMSVTDPAQVVKADLPRLAGLVPGKEPRTRQHALDLR